MGVKHHVYLLTYRCSDTWAQTGIVKMSVVPSDAVLVSISWTDIGSCQPCQSEVSEVADCDMHAGINVLRCGRARPTHFIVS